MLCTTYSWERCSRTGKILTLVILSHTMTDLLLLCIFVIRNSRFLRIPFVRHAQLLSAYSKLQYVKGSRELRIIPARDHLFRQLVARNMAHLHFIQRDRQDKTKRKTIFPYQHALWNISKEREHNCVSDGVQIHRGGTDSLKAISNNLLECHQFVFLHQSSTCPRKC